MMGSLGSRISEHPHPLQYAFSCRSRCRWSQIIYFVQLWYCSYSAVGGLECFLRKCRNIEIYLTQRKQMFQRVKGLLSVSMKNVFTSEPEIK